VGSSEGSVEGFGRDPRMMLPPYHAIPFVDHAEAEGSLRYYCSEASDNEPG